MTEQPMKVELFYDGAWQDITDDVRGNPSLDGGVTIRRGARDWATDVEAAQLTVSVNNDGGKFSFRDPVSPLWGKVGWYTPIRVWKGGEIRCVAEIVDWPVRWIADAVQWAPLTASGVLERLMRGDKPLESPLRRHYVAYGPQLVGYVPLEEPRDAGRWGSNLVPGTQPMVYRTGGSGNPLLPVWATDDTCPGSGPLPTFPAVDYFGWSNGASVRPHVAPWQVYVTFRLPAGSGEVWLGEWTTSGTLPRWELKATAGGVLQVRASADEPAPRTETWTSTAGAVDDGQWRSVGITVIPDGSGVRVRICVHGDDQLFAAVADVDPGRVTMIRPRPLFADSSGDPEPIGYGHMAVVGTLSDTPVLELANPGPADGHGGERAATRIRRLAGEADIPIRLPGLQRMLDRFDRTEPSGWGDGWSTSGGGQFSVNGSAGVMSLDTGQTGTAEAGTAEPDDVDVLTAVEVAGGAAFGGATRRSILFRDGNYRVSIDHTLASGLTLWRWNGSTFVLVAARSFFTEDFLNEGKVWIRVRAVGGNISARVWHDGHPEPIVWHVDYHDSSPLLDTGRPKLETVHFSVGQGSVTADIRWHHFEMCAADTSAQVGVQGSDTLIDTMRAAARVDNGILHEDRTYLGLAYRPLSTMYNQDPGAVLRYERPSGTGDVHELAPQDGPRYFANQVQVSRDGGASVVAELSSGRLSTRPPPDGIGTISRKIRLNLVSDDALPDHASWRLQRSAVDEMRWPRIGVNLARLAREGRGDLAAAVAGLESGDRVLVQNLPPGLPPDDVDQLVHGYEEHFDDRVWTWTGNADPFSPLWVGVWQEPGATPDPDAPARYSPEDSQTIRPFDAGSDTELLVVDGTGIDPWTEDVDAYPFDVAVSGVRLRATAAGPAVVDTFTRTVADGWGSPDVGPAWTLSGTAADFDVAAGVGTIAESSSFEGRWAVLDVEVGDFDLLVALNFSASELGDGGLVARAGAGPGPIQDFYEAALAPTLDLLWIARAVGGSFTTLASVAFTVDAATTYWLRFVGHGSLLLAKAWADGTTEPQGWMVSAVDTSHAAGRVGVEHFGDGGSLVVAFDNFALRNAQRLTVAQAPVNGVTKTIPAGSKVELWRPARYAL